MSITVTINRQAAIHIIRNLVPTTSRATATLADRLIELLRDYNGYGEPLKLPSENRTVDPNSAAAEILADSLLKIAIANCSPGLKTSWANIGDVRVAYYPKSKRHTFWDRLGPITEEQAIKSLAHMVASLAMPKATAQLYPGEGGENED